MAKQPATHCKNGHDKTKPGNAAQNSHGDWICLVCKRDRERKSRQRAGYHIASCHGCGQPKWPDQHALCGPCRWEWKRAHGGGEGGGQQVEKRLDILVAQELDPTPIKEARRRERELMDEHRRQLLRATRNVDRPGEDSPPS